MHSRSADDRFVVAEGSELASEHAHVLALIKEAGASLEEHEFYYPIDLKRFECGKMILAAAPAAARRYVLATIEQLVHCERTLERVRQRADDDGDDLHYYRRDWKVEWRRYRLLDSITKSLMRRNLPFDADDLTKLLTLPTIPVGAVSRAVQHFACNNSIPPELLVRIRAFAEVLRSASKKEFAKHAAAMEQLVADAIPADDAPPVSESKPRRPTPTPAPAGSPSVLVRLKRHFGMQPKPDAPDDPIARMGPDDFPFVASSSLRQEHESLSLFFQEAQGTHNYNNPNPKQMRHGRAVTHVAAERAPAMFLAAAERHVWGLMEPDAPIDDAANWQVRYTASATPKLAFPVGVQWSRAEAFDALLYISTRGTFISGWGSAIAALVEVVEQYAAQEPLAEGERYVLHLLRGPLVAGAWLGADSPETDRLTVLIDDGGAFCLAPGEVWADKVNSEFAIWSGAERRPWIALFRHMLSANSARPSKKWLKQARDAIEGVGESDYTDKLSHWLPLVARGRSLRPLRAHVWDKRGASDTMHDDNATILRGLLWTIPMLEQRERFPRMITDVTLSAYRKVPGVGPRAVKVGNAGVYALSEFGTTDAVGRLAVLKVRVKFGTAQKEIEKAYVRAAEALNIPRDEIEEMGVPAYGLAEVGSLVEPVGDYEAEIKVTGTDAELIWRDAKGKTLKTVPARARKDHSEEYKSLQQSLKDIKTQLPAQRDRIDSMFLAQRVWPIAAWRERYIDHPLVGSIGRRLIWCIDGVPVLFADGALTNVEGAVLEFGATAEVALWHPVGREVDETLAWRNRLEALQVTQPFKQAYREVYLLTAAEQNTATYSNRFAAHVIRQHQFNALCGARGWKNQLRLMVDSAFAAPSKTLPQWNLRAEFWVDGIGAEYGADTNEAGSYHYLATDQVRFYRIDAARNFGHGFGGGMTSDAVGPGRENINEPLRLDLIPLPVFSEIMRDVDLFVGVASVGNDPTWQDGGPDGRYREYRDYWTSYAFGDLSESAKTRKTVLERLIPRLKIADRCRLDGRFLVVRGDLRTYKIHLGSTNILMEPNDQYLCIVPGRSQTAREGQVYLPFEGDNSLSIILSKALMLAEDKKIKDQSILLQIRK